MDNLYEKMARMSPLQFWSSLRCLQWTDYGCLWSSCHCLRSEGWPNKKTQPNQGYSIWLLLVRCLGSLKRKTQSVLLFFWKTCRCFCSQLYLWERPCLRCGSHLPTPTQIPAWCFCHCRLCMQWLCCASENEKLSGTSRTRRIHLPSSHFWIFWGILGRLFKFVHKLSISVSARLNEVKSATQKHLYELISCVLMKSLAKSVSSRFQEFCS